MTSSSCSPDPHVLPVLSELSRGNSGSSQMLSPRVSTHILQACSVRTRCLCLSGCYYPQALWTACQWGSSSLEIVPSEANEGLGPLGLRDLDSSEILQLLWEVTSYLSYEMASLWSPHHTMDTESQKCVSCLSWQSVSQPGLYSWIIWLCLLWKGRRDEM